MNANYSHQSIEHLEVFLAVIGIELNQSFTILKIRYLLDILWNSPANAGDRFYPRVGNILKEMAVIAFLPWKIPCDRAPGRFQFIN